MVKAILNTRNWACVSLIFLGFLLPVCALFFSATPLFGSPFMAGADDVSSVSKQLGSVFLNIIVVFSTAFAAILQRQATVKAHWKSQAEFPLPYGSGQLYDVDKIEKAKTETKGGRSGFDMRNIPRLSDVPEGDVSMIEASKVSSKDAEKFLNFVQMLKLAQRQFMRNMSVLGADVSDKDVAEVYNDAVNSADVGKAIFWKCHAISLLNKIEENNHKIIYASSLFFGFILCGLLFNYFSHELILHVVAFWGDLSCSSEEIKSCSIPGGIMVAYVFLLLLMLAILTYFFAASALRILSIRMNYLSE